MDVMIPRVQTLVRIISNDGSWVSGGVTHQDLEPAEGGGGAVEEIGRQPSLVLVAVADGCAWGRRLGGVIA